MLLLHAVALALQSGQRVAVEFAQHIVVGELELRWRRFAARVVADIVVRLVVRMMVLVMMVLLLRMLLRMLLQMLDVMVLRMMMVVMVMRLMDGGIVEAAAVLEARVQMRCASGRGRRRNAAGC